VKEFYARLSSFERRAFFAFAIVALLIFNIFVVSPMLKQWGELKKDMAKAEKTLTLYEQEIAKTDEYKKRIAELEGQGAVVPQEDQGIDFLRTIQQQAAVSRVNVIANNVQQGRTNQFFIEKAQALTVQCGEENLVNFLFSLGEGASLIRVRDISLRPADPVRSSLSANMKLVASYQKKAPASKPATPAAAPKTSTPAPAAKPTAAPAAKPLPTPPANKPSTPTRK